MVDAESDAAPTDSPFKPPHKRKRYGTPSPKKSTTRRSQRPRNLIERLELIRPVPGVPWYETVMEPDEAEKKRTKRK